MDSYVCWCLTSRIIVHSAAEHERQAVTDGVCIKHFTREGKRCERLTNEHLRLILSYSFVKGQVPPFARVAATFAICLALPVIEQSWIGVFLGLKWCALEWLAKGYLEVELQVAAQLLGVVHALLEGTSILHEVCQGEVPVGMAQFRQIGGVIKSERLSGKAFPDVQYMIETLLSKFVVNKKNI